MLIVIFLINIYIYINIAIWGCEGTILGQTQVLKQFCECHRTWTLLYREMWKSSPCCLSAVSPVSLQNFWWIGLNDWMSWSTWFMQWFNCILLDFPVKLPVFCILTLDVIGVYLDWIIFAGSLYATHDLAEFGKSANADDLGIGQSCETIQALEMSWTSCLQNFVRYLTTLPAHMINAMNFANCWSCRFCQAALGCPMPPHKPVRSQKKHDIVHGSSGGFHLSSYLLASCYISFYTAQSLQCMPVWQGQEPSWFAPTRWFGDQSLHAFPHATPIIQTLWLRARYSGLLAGDFPIFKASKFVHHFQSIFMASWL